MRLSLSILLVCLVSPIGAAAAAPLSGDTLFSHLDIDFRSDALFSGCKSNPICLSAVSNPLPPVTVSTNAGSLLYWDNRDGFGIMGGENDEIDGEESLTVAFDRASPFALSAIALTDLFLGEIGGTGSERALISFFFGGEEVGPVGGLTVTQTIDHANGEALFTFDDSVIVDTIVFQSTGDPNDEYSVAGLSGVIQSGAAIVQPTDEDGDAGGAPLDEGATGSEPPVLVLPPELGEPQGTPTQPVPVPGPASMLMVLAGVAGLIGVARYRFRR